MHPDVFCRCYFKGLMWAFINTRLWENYNVKGVCEGKDLQAFRNGEILTISYGQFYILNINKPAEDPGNVSELLWSLDFKACIINLM